MALIVGVKHYPRTLLNIDSRIADLDYLRRFLNLSNKPKAKQMQRIIERALKRYDAYLDKLAWRLKRIEFAKKAKLRGGKWHLK